MHTLALMTALAVAEPTFLGRRLDDVAAAPSDLTTSSCRFRPLFVAGDGGIVRGVTRFGQLVVDAGGQSATVARPDDEEVYLLVEGAGTLSFDRKHLPLRRSDFAYLPPGGTRGFSCSAAGPCKLLLVGYRVANKSSAEPSVANIDDVVKQVLPNHPPTARYQLLVGDRRSKRDRLAVAEVLKSLFIIDILPGGTNDPHHHDKEEEIYFVLDGEGEIVAGTGRRPAKAGDAYFYRPGTTVGFYAGSRPARILALRSTAPAASPSSD